MVAIAMVWGSLVACGDDDGNSDGNRTGSSQDAGPGPGDSGGGPTRPERAYLIGQRFNTPDGRVGYMGIFPELPSEPIEVSGLFELPDAGGRLWVCGENVFQNNGGNNRIEKYLIGDDLSITPAESLLIGEEGIEGGAFSTVCVSSTQAYMFSRDASRGVEFNPETMVILDSFDIPAPPLEDGLPAAIFEGETIGNLSYFSVRGVNFGELRYSTRAIVATFDSSDESWTYTTYDGCASSINGSRGDDGSFFLDPGSEHGLFLELSEQAETTEACSLRIPPGTREFDPASFAAVPGNVRSSYPISDDFLFVQRIAQSAPPADPDALGAWFSYPVDNFRVDRETGTSTPYSGLNDQAVENGRRVEIDGRRLVQMRVLNSEGGTERTELFELLPDGPSAAPVITVIGGDVLRLTRVW
ncbi:MAG: hypothetical protein AAGJ19_18400 [Myxococcota bacterium]